MAVPLAYLGSLHIQSRLYRWLWLLALLVLANPVVLAPFLLFAVFRGIRRHAVAKAIPANSDPRLCSGGERKIHCPVFVDSPAALVLLEEVAIRRRFPLVFCGLALCYFGWYLAAHQSLSGFAAYLSNAVAITSGYTPGMNFGPTPAIRLLLGAALFVIAAASYLFAVLPAHRWKLFHAAWVGLFFFVGFKHAFVRYDEPMSGWGSSTILCRECSSWRY